MPTYVMVNGERVQVPREILAQGHDAVNRWYSEQVNDVQPKKKKAEKKTEARGAVTERENNDGN